ncbi:MAG: hypothetical protein Q9198_009440 [Flavoplaca austrocitrina]
MTMIMTGYPAAWSHKKKLRKPAPTESPRLIEIGGRNTDAGPSSVTYFGLNKAGNRSVEIDPATIAMCEAALNISEVRLTNRTHRRWYSGELADPFFGCLVSIGIIVPKIRRKPNTSNGNTFQNTTASCWKSLDTSFGDGNAIKIAGSIYPRASAGSMESIIGGEAREAVCRAPNEMDLDVVGEEAV